jgi:DNA-binding response OmpR family regulator
LRKSGTPASARLRPAIFIIAQDEDRVRQQASRIPNSVYLRKPVVGAVLLEAIRSLPNRRRIRCGESRNTRPRWGNGDQ